MVLVSVKCDEIIFCLTFFMSCAEGGEAVCGAGVLICAANTHLKGWGSSVWTDLMKDPGQCLRNGRNYTLLCGTSAVWLSLS